MNRRFLLFCMSVGFIGSIAGCAHVAPTMPDQTGDTRLPSERQKTPIIYQGTIVTLRLYQPQTRRVEIVVKQLKEAGPNGKWVLVSQRLTLVMKTQNFNQSFNREDVEPGRTIQFTAAKRSGDAPNVETLRGIDSVSYVDKARISPQP